MLSFFIIVRENMCVCVGGWAWVCDMACCGHCGGCACGGGGVGECYRMVVVEVGVGYFFFVLPFQERKFGKAL